MNLKSFIIDIWAHGFEGKMAPKEMAELINLSGKFPHTVITADVIKNSWFLGIDRTTNTTIEDQAKEFYGVSARPRKPLLKKVEWDFNEELNDTTETNTSQVSNLDLHNVVA